tara:strand:- start:2677 stop:4017 length:1341 start_codon:yes stop_codon:yes gene_type:complete
MNIIKKNINELKSDPANARTHSIKNIKAIKDSLEVFGQQKPIVVDDRGVVIAGNGTLQAATELGWKEINIVETALDPAHAQAFGIADNRTAELADWDVEVLEQLMKNMDSELAEILAIDDIELPSLTDEKVKAEKELHKNKLSEAFGIPPFSVLNAREGWWQDRKRAWLSLGIKSELGRENVTKSGDGSVVALEYFNNGETIGDDSGSVFDPVITELAYRWFCPKGGVVVDPFAGGSVRGIVASKLGLEYSGLDVRAEQVEANNEQAENICVSVEGENPVWHCNDSREIDVVLKEKKADFIFSCPPYGDLEVYSDNPNDLSVLPYNDFRKAYFEIINKTCSLLRENSFACFVVGEFRDKQGNYQNFVGDTIQAFLDAGLHYYNEAIMVTPIGSLPFRAGRYFRSTRKLGKGHQNVLVFVKGDGKKASEACGECDFGEEEQNKLDET